MIPSILVDITTNNNKTLTFKWNNFALTFFSLFSILFGCPIQTHSFYSRFPYIFLPSNGFSASEGINHGYLFNCATHLSGFVV